MKKTIILTTIFLLVAVGYANSQTGKWKSYLSYDEPTEIEEANGNMLYVLASNGLYAYNKNDHSLQIYDKTTVLNDCGIAHIAWCKAAKRLVIVYENHNIDLLEQNSNVLNMADYLNKSMTLDKTVYSIDISGQYAYLATGFGVVKLHVANAEISDTYQLGFKVDYSYTEGPYLYAASSTHGLYRGLLTDNLLDKAKWTRVGNFTARPKTMDPNNLALVKTLRPGGPKYNNFGFIRMHQGALYTVGGGYLAVTDLNRPGCVQVLNNGNWQIYDDDLKQKTGHDFIDLNSVDIDPTNPQRVFASGRTGLYEFNHGEFVKEYTPENSPLQGAATVSADSKDYNLVQGIKFDSDANLWVLNSMSATTSILKYGQDSKWTNHHKPELVRDGYSLSRMQNPIIDSRGMLWFVNKFFNYTQAVCYQPSTDAVKTYTNFVNDDGTTLNITYVNCVSEDKDHNIWIGTNVGPMYLSPEQISAENPVFTQVKVPRNDGTNYADYLLSGIDINCMVVDQANRKWFGTNGNGVYLISSDNIHQIEHFTEENSNLFSNNIESIAINENTGEVFFGTDKGLCSYMSNATTATQGMTKDNVYAYPNPVRPDYTGPITITGLDENVDVKIVTANGTLVSEGRASGGKFKWYGIDRSGRSVASGVYMVVVADQEGEKGVVCKIAIVR
ncbi:two-component regulator propeller domain-containing protein [Hallella bergensis]|uniref:type IX secretion system anionic LPS delivery protein PorZ n=1 Tax=Hallella bergensis TaxID=242750 RepID=UPI0023F2FA7F|nr:two-component regulator propeller domain-containing protein [Hallella bergensis]